MPTPTERIQAQLAYLYGTDTASQVGPQLAERMAQFKPTRPRLPILGGDRGADMPPPPSA